MNSYLKQGISHTSENINISEALSETCQPMDQKSVHEERQEIGQAATVDENLHTLAATMIQQAGSISSSTAAGTCNTAVTSTTSNIDNSNHIAQ